MRLADYLDKGASVNADAPAFTTDSESLSYAEVQSLADRVAAALVASGVQPGQTVAILSANDPIAFASMFGISRSGAVWSPINPRNEATENRDLLDRFDCVALIYQGVFAELVAEILPELPKVHTVVKLDGDGIGQPFEEWTATGSEVFSNEPVDDVAMIVGTGGTTGVPKGVVLTNQNLETMTSIVLMSYPFVGRPVYLALAPLTHAAGVLSFPILASGGEVVIMRKPEIHEFAANIAQYGVTHTFLPPTLIYMLLEIKELDETDLSSLQCFWYGAAPISIARLTEALKRIGPVMAQLFGQTEAPMMLSTLAPVDHFLADGSVAHTRLSSAGRAAPLVQLEIMNADGIVLPSGQKGEIVAKSTLVMAGYYKDPEATAAADHHGWHRTGDIGYLDDDGYLYIVDRAKDIIITGGFNVYSAEVEQALMRFPGVRDCAVVGVPDDKWGERVTAVLECEEGTMIDKAEVITFTKAAIGSVKAPKSVEIWHELPRSKVGKVVKAEVRERLT